MIEILIFHFHICGALYAFTKNMRNRSLKEGFLALAVLALIFAVGWAITNPISSMIWPNSWSTIWFNRDTLSLVLLVIPESFFFYKFFVKDKEEPTGKTI